MAVVPVVPPNAPDWAKSFLQDTTEALKQLSAPQGPTPLYAVTSAQLTGVLAADLWPNCQVIVTDKKCIGVSTLNAGAWAWTRADGTAS